MKNSCETLTEGRGLTFPDPKTKVKQREPRELLTKF